MKNNTNIVLIIGSAPDATRSREWNVNVFSHLIAINNAWRVREDWDYLIHPEDFPMSNWPNIISAEQTIVTAREYVPIQNDFGGFVYAGGTMAFTAAYWALGHLRPKLMAFIGCDMVYPESGRTHFYGNGEPDPLRNDLTLQSLEAKSARLLYMAHQKDCLCVNLSNASQSRLVFPRITMEVLHTGMKDGYDRLFEPIFNESYSSKAINLESKLGYYFASGRYWEYLDSISANECSNLDSLWLQAFNQPEA